MDCDLLQDRKSFIYVLVSPVPGNQGAGCKVNTQSYVLTCILTTNKGPWYARVLKAHPACFQDHSIHRPPGHHHSLNEHLLSTAEHHALRGPDLPAIHLCFIHSFISSKPGQKHILGQPLA